MLRLLLISALRFHLRQPGQFLLALAGISLGVAAFIGIQNANRAAERAFALSTESFAGQTSHRIIGVGRDLQTTTYVDLARRGFGDRMAPVIATEARIVAGGSPGTRVDLLGIDPVEELRLQRFFPVAEDPGSVFLRLMSEPGTVLATPDLVDSLSLQSGDEIVLRVDGRPVSLRFVAPLAAAEADIAGLPMLVTDIGTLEPHFGRGRLSRIDLALDDAQADALGGSLPPGTTLVATGNRNSELAAMTRAFTTNLTALGLLALVVGLFLIHATMSFSVVRRRAQIATLRALGLSRLGLITAIGLEAALIGAVAGLAGAVLGNVLSDVLIGLVLRTMNDLAFSRAIVAGANPWWQVPVGLSIGVATTLISAVLPAREAAAMAPAEAESRSELERDRRRTMNRLAVGSIPTALVAVAVVVLWPQGLLPGFLALFLLLVAGAMCVPFATTILMKLLERPSSAIGGLPAVMAVRSVTASLSRTGVATAALAIAVATVMSIGLMVGSFRTSLVEWIDDTLTADFYILIDSGDADTSSVDRWASAIASLPGVAGISRTQRAIVPARTGDIGIRASEPGPEGWGIDLVAGYQPDWQQRLADGSGIIVSEPYAYRHELTTGDELVLPTASGDTSFAVVGISREYNTAGAAALISLGRYRAEWQDEGLSGIGVHLNPGADGPALGDAISGLRPGGVDSVFRSTDSIRRISLTLFDRTFEITAVLRGVAGIVAFFGILSAILALQLERRREFAILRSIGMSLAQLRAHVIVQTTLLGLSAAICAMPVGLVLAWLLVFVINRRAFGWTMSFELAPTPIGYGAAIAILAAMLAGLAASFLGGGALRSGTRNAV